MWWAGAQVWQTLQDALEPGTRRNQPGWQVDPGDDQLPGRVRRGPVIVIDEDMYGNVTPAQVSEILARYE